MCLEGSDLSMFLKGQRKRKVNFSQDVSSGENSNQVPSEYMSGVLLLESTCSVSLIKVKGWAPDPIMDYDLLIKTQE
jgi:hypothetical protein